MQVLNFRQLPAVRHTRSCRLSGPAPGRRSLVLAQASAVDAVAGAVKEAADGITKTVSGNGRPPQTGEVKRFPGRDQEGDIHHPREQTILLQGKQHTTKVCSLQLLDLDRCTAGLQALAGAAARLAIGGAS